jgi:Heparinase II/III-like protein/Heparinase II/III N-terminus
MRLVVRWIPFRASGERIDLLRRLAPHPALLARSVAHAAARRAQQRVVRRTYGWTVATARGRADLVPPIVDLPRLDDLPAALRPAALELRAEAESILDHRFDILGSGPVQLGDEIDWHLDFKSGYRWPRVRYQDVEVTRLTDASDAKVPWELSRCHHLLTLARAARLFDDGRFAEELESQLESWLAENPSGYGINWAGPMEVALRAVNWVWAVGTLEQWRPLSEPLRTEVARSLEIHGRHIATNLEGAPHLRSNHYLANILGLLVLGAVLAGDSRTARWFRRAHAAFEREISAQVHADGIGFEASLPYHGLSLEMFLVAKKTADEAGRPFSPAFHQRLERMLEASRALRHPDGRFPQIGDGDSGRVLPAGFRREPSIDNLLSTGAALFGQQRPLPRDPHEEVAWTLGVEAWERLAERPAAAASARCAFPASGFYVLRGSRAHVVVRCGDIGQSGNGGHAHNDLLSFELSHGVPVIVDSGTYAYTSDPEARNLFRSTPAHNTVVVAGAEINPITPSVLFRLAQFAHPRVECWEEGPERVRLVVSHDGYRRLTPPVIHRRTYALERGSDELEVVDELEGDCVQRAESFIHFAPDSALTEVGPREWEIRIGDVRCRVELDGFDEVRLSEGWISDRFGVREPGPVLVGAVVGRMPIRFAYRLTAAPDTT